MYGFLHYTIVAMKNIKIKFPWSKKKSNIENTTELATCEESVFKASFEDYLNSIKAKSPEEKFAIAALKALCHSPSEYNLMPDSQLSFVVYCFDGKDKEWYVRFFAKMLCQFQPLWNHYNAQDFLRKLGIRFATSREGVIGLNVKGVLVSYKWIGFLTGNVTIPGFERNCKILQDWHDNLEYFECRMQSRFKDDYFIWMGSEKNAAYPGAEALPRLLDLESYVQAES